MNLLDTSVLVENIANDNYAPALISPITLMEFLRGLDDKKRKTMNNLLADSFSILNIDDKIIESYCNIYQIMKKEGKLLPDADLIIAATAIAYNLTLETRDSHFQRLKTMGLKLK